MHMNLFEDGYDRGERGGWREADAVWERLAPIDLRPCTRPLACSDESTLPEVSASACLGRRLLQ